MILIICVLLCTHAVVYATNQNNISKYEYLLVYQIKPVHPKHNYTFLVTFPLTCSGFIDKNTTTYHLNTTSIWHYKYDDYTYIIETHYKDSNNKSQPISPYGNNSLFLFDSLTDFNNLTECNTSIYMAFRLKNDYDYSKYRHNDTCDGLIYKHLFRLSEIPNYVIHNLELLTNYKNGRNNLHRTKRYLSWFPWPVNITNIFVKWIADHMGLLTSTLTPTTQSTFSSLPTTSSESTPQTTPTFSLTTLTSPTFSTGTSPSLTTSMSLSTDTSSSSTEYNTIINSSYPKTDTFHTTTYTQYSITTSSVSTVSPTTNSSSSSPTSSVSTVSPTTNSSSSSPTSSVSTVSPTSSSSPTSSVSTVSPTSSSSPTSSVSTVSSTTNSSSSSPTSSVSKDKTKTTYSTSTVTGNLTSDAQSTSLDSVTNTTPTMLQTVTPTLTMSVMSSPNSQSTDTLDTTRITTNTHSPTLSSIGRSGSLLFDKSSSVTPPISTTSKTIRSTSIIGTHRLEST
ncbi:glycoprotein ORF-P [Elephant endotheliotropic herpesvirus 6]|nr:glycoprotein ORF-P [Elephant endotheliotropic herpesvirus 6]UEH20660.1 glycoprotein ORF-P [Elephant endotheliotropic herpesvirus 6]